MSGESEISSDQWMAVCEKDGQQETKIGEANAHEKRRVLQKVETTMDILQYSNM